MALNKQIRFDLNNELYRQVKAQENCSEFIRTAIEEKLSRKKSDDNDILRILKQIERLDPNAMHEDTKNILVSLTTIFGEMQKQNQILKLILRRASLASKFGATNLETSIGKDMLQKIEQEVIKFVTSEIQNINI